jgi:hypothetical protein
MRPARPTLAPTMVSIPAPTLTMLLIDVLCFIITVIDSSMVNWNSYCAVLPSTALPIVVKSCTYNIKSCESRLNVPPKPYLFNPSHPIKVSHCINH